MKNKLLLLLILGIAFFASCNDSNDDDDDAIVGTWKVTPVEADAEGSFVSGSLEMKWEADSAQIMGMSVENCAALAEQLGSILLPQVLKDVTFQKNGQVVATYSDAGISIDTDEPVEPNWKTSEPKYLTYKVLSDSQMALYLNLTNILGAANADLTAIDLDPADVQTLMAFASKVAKDGVVVKYNLVEETGKLTITVTKELFDQVMPLLPIVKKLIPADNDYAGLISLVLEMLPDAWAKTTAFEISLKLEK